MSRRIPLCFLLLLIACDGPTDDTDAGASDAGHDADVLPPRVHEELPTPEGLTAGVATVRIQAPVGIGTVGFAGFTEDPNPTPFSELFPGTTRSHGDLSFRAVALSRGDAFEVVFVRLDTVGVYQQLREAVLDEMETRIGRRLDESLIMAANHTHSGPGRMLQVPRGSPLNVAADNFFPEFYDGVVNAVADAVEMALDDRRPAELGLTVASTSAAHEDRRCENDSLPQIQESPDMPLVVVRREDRIDAIVASYGYHGTIQGYDALTLSGDMGSFVEERIEQRFDHPVTVLFFNSWGGDMAPSNPPESPTASGPMQPNGYDRMERLGEVVADAVMPEIAMMAFSSDHAIRARTYRVRLDTEVIGYDAETFNYPHGGLYCTGEGNCTDSTRVEGLDSACVTLNSRAGLPKQTLLSAGQVGDLFFVTAPGEWTTALAASVLDEVRSVSGGNAMFIGYAQDYTGYSTGLEDWWQGGYEASGAIWGPSQGDYLADRSREAFSTFFEAWTEPPWRQPAVVPAFSGYDGYELYVPESPVGLGTVSTDVTATVTSDDIVTFTVQGSDPWLGVPVASLESADGTAVMRSTGLPVDSHSHDLWVDLTVEPTYVDMERASERTFSWTFSFPVSHRAGSSMPDLAGGYRFRVSVPAEGGPTEVTTGTFTVM